MANPKNNTKKKHSGDQSFDDRAVHLNRNVYGSDKGRLRLTILQRDLSMLIKKNEQPLSILDAGCGAGHMSEWALKFGHSLTACDSSLAMIYEAKLRLGELSQITFCHSTIQDLPINQQYDVIFCHAVLEWVEDQDRLLKKLTALLKPNGYISLMFYNAWAREMAQMVYGNFSYIDRDYAVNQRVKLSPHYPAFPDIIEQQLQAQGLTVTIRSGIRVFYDIIRDKNHYQTLADDIILHELRVSQQYPYWQMGRYVHYLATHTVK